MTVRSWRRAFAMAAAVVVGALLVVGSPGLAQAAVPVPEAGRFYEVVNRTSGGCLEVDYGQTYDRADATEDWCYGYAQYQRWQFRSVGPNVYEIVVQHTRQCLTVDELGVFNPGANVRQEACAGQDRQRWSLGDAANGYVQIRSEESGHCLDLAGGHWDVVQWTCYGDNHNQRWLLQQ